MGTQHSQRTPGIGTQNHGSPTPQRIDRPRRRMAVRVVRAHRDEGEPGCQALEQRRVLVGGAVVGDLEDVHGGQLRV
ncbi:hypothetical protein [Streptomyces benahoarensis]|uniref:hypothetical protein n=1 Tax=Streptomyces benahoarensis TaxID=2595054 RepID=UPI003D808D7F